MQNIKVVITGGPSSGKTTLINELKAKGYLCFEEISRQITIEAQKNGIEQPFLDDPEKFSEILLSARFKQYKDAKDFKSVVFFDRGVHDVLGYMHYANEKAPESFLKTSKETQYDTVFILPPWSKIHVQDNERYETFEQAQQIYKSLLKIYTDFGYKVIEVPFGTVTKRMQFILDNL